MIAKRGFDAVQKLFDSAKLFLGQKKNGMSPKTNRRAGKKVTAYTNLFFGAFKKLYDIATIFFDTAIRLDEQDIFGRDRKKATRYPQLIFRCA
jgi:hypothetical protein